MKRYALLRLLPLVLAVLALLALGAWLVPLLHAPQGRTYRFYVEDATGLPEGTEVRFRGLVVGQVTRVALDEERSRQRRSPWFEVAFQPVLGGERVLDLWSFRAVKVEKETPMIGATVVTLADAAMPGGRTPDVLDLQPTSADDLSGDLREITAGIKQVVASANDAMMDLKKELEARPEGPFNPERPTRVAAMLGSLQDAAHHLSVAGDHISTLTDEQGSVTTAFQKFSALSDDLVDDDRPFLSTFSDIRRTSTELRGELLRTGQLIERTSPNLERGTANAAQMLDTLKREPWRMLWKSTKIYDDAVVAATPTPTPAVKARKRQVSVR